MLKYSYDNDSVACFKMYSQYCIYIVVDLMLISEIIFTLIFMKSAFFNLLRKQFNYRIYQYV